MQLAYPSVTGRHSPDYPSVRALPVGSLFKSRARFIFVFVSATMFQHRNQLCGAEVGCFRTEDITFVPPHSSVLFLLVNPGEGSSNINMAGGMEEANKVYSKLSLHP